MRLRRSVAILGTVLVFVPALGFAENPKLARFSFSSGWDALPAIVAIERGFFAQESLVVSGLTITSFEAVTGSLVRGSTDFAAVPQRTLLAMAAAELPVAIISMSGWGTEMELVVPKEEEAIKSMAELKGKTIGVGMASEAFPVLIRLLNKAKLRPDDVKIKQLPAEALTRAFDPKNKQADAVLESRHYTTVLLKKGQGRLVLTHKDITEAIGFIGAAPLLTRHELIEKEPDIIQKFVNAWVKAQKYIQQDPEDAARLLVIFFHRQGVKTVSEDLTRTWVEMTRYNRFVWTPADVADAEYNGWGLKEGGLLKASPKLESYVENRFAEAALKTLEASGVAGGVKGSLSPP